MNECILVVDDDREIVGAIAIVLEREGYTVRRAYDGLGAVEQALDPAVRLILIDVMMPKLDGLSALMRIREKRNLPVIVLSAKSEDTDKILGLSMGADDYVTKPYNPQELAARVRSQLRRYTLLGDVHAEKREGEIVNGRLSYDPERRELKADGELVKLTATELKIVDLLMRNPGRVFPAEEIYQRVWQSDSYACENNLNDMDTWIFFKWAFKSAAAVLIVTNTWTIVMGVFDAAQSVVASASGLIIGDTSINISSVMVGIEDRLMEMELGPLFGLWFQSLFVGITMWALTICIFIITFGRMIEIYLVTSVAPIPMATMMGKEWGGMGQNYIRSLLALGFQAFLIIVCVAIYAVLVQNIALVDDIIYAIWTCMGYTVLLCFCLFKTSSLAKSVFNAH